MLNQFDIHTRTRSQLERFKTAVASIRYSPMHSVPDIKEITISACNSYLLITTTTKKCISIRLVDKEEVCKEMTSDIKGIVENNGKVFIINEGIKIFNSFNFLDPQTILPNEDLRSLCIGNNILFALSQNELIKIDLTTYEVIQRLKTEGKTIACNKKFVAILKLNSTSILDYDLNIIETFQTIRYTKIALSSSDLLFVGGSINNKIQIFDCNKKIFYAEYRTKNKVDINFAVTADSLYLAIYDKDIDLYSITDKRHDATIKINVKHLSLGGLRIASFPMSFSIHSELLYFINASEIFVLNMCESYKIPKIMPVNRYVTKLNYLGNLYIDNQRLSIDENGLVTIDNIQGENICIAKDGVYTSSDKQLLCNGVPRNDVCHSSTINSIQYINNAIVSSDDKEIFIITENLTQNPLLTNRQIIKRMENLPKTRIVGIANSYILRMNGNSLDIINNGIIINSRELSGSVICFNNALNFLSIKD